MMLVYDCVSPAVSRSINVNMRPASHSPYLWEPAKNARESTNGRQVPAHLRSCPSILARCYTQQQKQRKHGIVRKCV